MFLTQPTLMLDPIWRVTSACAADGRAGKMNLAIGVYRDETGECAVQDVVRAAELRIAERSDSKEYTSPAGNLLFNARMTELVFGDGRGSDDGGCGERGSGSATPERGSVDPARIAAIQAVGGTGALRLLAELLRITGPDRTVHLGTPAYVNHHAILGAAGLAVAEYSMERADASGFGRVFDPAGVLAAARTAKPGDAILLQGCCHNPTGYSMPLEVWEELARVMAERGVVPFIDHAYMGLGDGLEADLAGMRRMLEIVPEAVVAVSAAKAWALYNERTGIAFVVGRDAERAQYAMGVLEVVARAAYSQAPSHGASVVAEVLDDPELRTRWQAELEGMRSRLNRTREALVGALLEFDDSESFAGLSERRGMFLSLPLDETQMLRLREEHAIYGTPSGRINIAGIPVGREAEVADAIIAARGIGV